MTAPELNHVHKVQNVYKVIDGDTYVFDVDLDYADFTRIKVRLHAIDVYESDTPEGQNATDYVKGKLGAASEILIKSYKDAHSFDRWVCDVWIDGLSLEEDLRAHGFAKPIEHLG